MVLLIFEAEKYNVILMKALLFILFISMFLSLSAQSKKDSYKQTDKAIASIPDSLTWTTDGIAGFINENFRTESDKVRAVYMWVADNISYDLDVLNNLHKIRKDSIRSVDILKSRKGICEHYAVLFAEIANKTGLKSYVVSGYTKQNSVVDSIGHAWCAAMVDSAWYLFDPTWGAGGLINGKYVKNVNTKYYRINPAKMIKDHMPYDPMWQMLSYTISNSEFETGLTGTISRKSFFSFADSLALFEQQSKIERIIAEERRVANSGITNELVKEYHDYLTNYIFVYNANIEVEKHNARVTEHNAIVEQYNKAVVLSRDCVNRFNEFINYRNSRFLPAKPDSEILEMIMLPFRLRNEAWLLVSDLSAKNADLSKDIKNLKDKLQEIQISIDEHKIFTENYLAASKSKRPTMFYKVKKQ